MSIREHMDRLGDLQPFGQQAEWTVALYDWMLAVTAALETKDCPCRNVRNRADNTRAFCPHCNGIDAKGKRRAALEELTRISEETEGGYR